MDRTLLALAIVGLGTGCPFQPDEDPVPEITGDDDSTDGASSGATVDDSTGTSDDPVTTQPDTSDTDTPATCGDGSVDGDEVCDDGVNDGSYGSCAADCSAFAPFCGDGSVDGDEVCDDGVNDGNYGGCASDCTALGPHCGDGEQQAEEQCDEGASNQNGSGCNIDCIRSGTVVGTYQLDGLDFCDGDFVTEPAFRADGNVLVGATGYCDDDSVALVELSSSVELVQQFDGLLLPETPAREGVLVGDDWVLASSSCNYRIDPAGTLVELCGNRTVGNASLTAAPDGSYVALDYDLLALYPSGSPMAGDAPTWSLAPPDNATFDYYFADATFGESGSVVVVGGRTTIGTPTSVGYVARYTAAGNLVDDYALPVVTAFGGVMRASDGSVLLVGSYPNYGVYRLDADFNQVWSSPIMLDSDNGAAFDSTDAVVLVEYDPDAVQYVLRKLTPDGQTELWNLVLPVVGNGVRLAIDASDAIWLATVTYPATLSVVKVSP